MSKVARNSKIAERRIESALAPGRFISDNVSFDFVRGLEAVENEISNLVRSDSKQAASLYESFLAGCYAKAEGLNGSAWSFGQFVRELFCGWIKGRQASRADPGDTAARLVAWMDDDPYGFCHRLEKDAVEVLNKTGLAALEKKIRPRFEAATPTEPVPGISPPSQDCQRRRSSEILRTIYISRRDIASYITLSKATRFTEADCQTLATMLLARRKPADALYWVERGLALGEQISGSSTESNDLLRLKRELLTKLGRRDEAIHAGWREFTGHPSELSHEELMKYVPKAEKETWHKKAIEAAIGTDLDLLLPLLLETKELERLADLAGRSEDSVLERVSHLTTKPAARKLEKTHPGIAARLWRAQGMRILDVKKSKYYPETLQNFRCARRCYERAGLSSEWLRVVDQLRADHHRKAGFIAGFEELVAGKPPSKKHHFSTRRRRARACHRLRTRNKATHGGGWEGSRWISRL